VLLEPPGPDLPPRAGLTISGVDLLRGAAAVAALVIALLSRGDALVLAGLLVLASWRLTAGAIIVPALVAASWRWGSTSLEALAGAQAVLGPAGLVGPERAATAAWLAAAALVLSVPARARSAGPQLVIGVVIAATGATAALVVAGPAAGGEWWIRAVATITAVGGAALASAVRGGRERICDVLAIALAVAALVLVLLDAPGWSGTVDTAALRTGALTALAVGALAVAGARTAAAMGQRRP
jgi:hypothetical protein